MCRARASAQVDDAERLWNALNNLRGPFVGAAYARAPGLVDRWAP
jgi:hypothetical protein